MLVMETLHYSSSSILEVTIYFRSDYEDFARDLTE